MGLYSRKFSKKKIHLPLLNMFCEPFFWFTLEAVFLKLFKLHEVKDSGKI